MTYDKLDVPGTVQHMRIAALYDIHGNLPALEAVLDDINESDIDLVVVGGDVAWGPFPRQTLELLKSLSLDTVFIRGNADREVAQHFSSDQGLDEINADVTIWCAEQLTLSQREWLLDLPEKVARQVSAIGEVLFCHGSPRSDEESLTSLTSDVRIRRALHGVVEPTVVCGHTHMQFERFVDDRRVINAGSVGMPYQGEPGAYWALLGPGVELRKTTYDTTEAVIAMRRTACPHVDEVFVDVILRPPAADQVAHQFEVTAEARFGDS